MLTICHCGVEPANDLLRRLKELRSHHALKSMHVVAQQFGIVVKHFLEMRNYPSLIYAVTMEAAGKLVVRASASHLVQRHHKCLAGQIVIAAHCHFKQKIESRWMRKLGLRSKAAISRIELGQRRPNDLVDKCDIQVASGRKTLVVLNSGHYAACRF